MSSSDWSPLALALANRYPEGWDLLKRGYVLLADAEKLVEKAEADGFIAELEAEWVLDYVYPTIRGTLTVVALLLAVAPAEAETP